MTHSSPGRWWPLIWSLAWLLAGVPILAEAPAMPPVVIPVQRVFRPPLVDGHGLDEAWRAAAWALLPDPALAPQERIAVKACTDGKRLFLLIRFPAVAERRRHRPWRWDPTAQQYLSGTDTEQALTVLLFGPGETADVWIWRADRTDAAGHADDGWFTPVGGFVPDRGAPCWESRYVANFAGAELPRFYPRQPSGSMADVRARGIWEEGNWTVEISRALDTGHDDDLPLVPGDVVGAQIFSGLPSGVPTPERPQLRLTMPPPAGDGRE